MEAALTENTVFSDQKQPATEETVAGHRSGAQKNHADLTEAEQKMQDEELAFYYNASEDHGDDNIWGLLSGVGGNIYEWYDFAVYGLLAPEIGSAFFPQSSKKLQLISSFGVYLAAFLMRPAGAILFGEMGDRILGRRHALIFSILLITIPSILMGCLPTYETWGAFSAFLLIILRMLQGLSVGGQLAGSYVLSIEQSSSKTRGFRGSICDASSVGGFLLASAVTTMTRSVLTEEQVNRWGWRVPFLFSLLLAPLLFAIVSKTEESKLWSERAEQKNAEKIVREKDTTDSPAVVDLFSSPFRRRQLAGMIGVLSAVTSSFYTIFLWTPVYLSELRGIMNEREADLINFFVVAIYICFLLAAGKLSDIFPHRKDLIRIGLPALAVTAPTMFAVFESESWVGHVLAQLQFCMCLALIQGSMAAWEVELWMSDPTLSFTGVAVGHNIAATIFGGTMPLVATFLYYMGEHSLDSSGDDIIWPRLLPGLYISLLGCISFHCVSNVVRHPHDLRTGDLNIQEAVKRKMNETKGQKCTQKQALENELSSSDCCTTSNNNNYLPPII